VPCGRLFQSEAKSRLALSPLLQSRRDQRSSGKEHRMDNDLNPQKTPPSGVHRIVVAGGGFGGFYTSYHLEKSFKNHPDTEITLISENNYFLMTPLLFEAGSGVLEPRHAVNPLRTMLKKARFVEARIEAIDFDQRKVFATHFPDNYRYE
jgi:hypothetical protein